MKTIIISPYARKMKNGEENPKHYPYWKDLIKLLKDRGYNIVQIGIEGETKIDGVDSFETDISFTKLSFLIRKSQFWISVDNFINHYGSYLRKRGAVIWGKSDPNIFGYEQNVNILKSRKNLRKNQFLTWEEDFFDPNVFLHAKSIIHILVDNGLI